MSKQQKMKTKTSMQKYDLVDNLIDSGDGEGEDHGVRQNVFNNYHHGGGGDDKDDFGGVDYGADGGDGEGDGDDGYGDGGGDGGDGGVGSDSGDGGNGGDGGDGGNGGDGGMTVIVVVITGNGSWLGFATSAAVVHNLWKDQSQGMCDPI